MSVFHNNALIGAGGGAAAAAAEVATKSLRFNGADTPELTRTPSSAGNTKTFTISFWTKRSFVSASGFHMVVQTDTQYHNIFRIFFSQGKLRVQQSDQDAGGSVRYDLVTTQLFRDPSAWYHIVVAVDTTQSTASDRVKLYLNGAQITTLIQQITPRKLKQVDGTTQSIIALAESLQLLTEIFTIMKDI